MTLTARATTNYDEPLPGIAGVSLTGQVLNEQFDSRPKAITAAAPYLLNTAGINQQTVVTVCTHLGYTFSSFDTRFRSLDNFFFLGGSRIDSFIFENKLEKITNNTYAYFENNLPVALLMVMRDPTRSYAFEAFGKKEFVDAVETMVTNLVRPIDPDGAMTKNSYYELVDYGYRDEPMWNVQEVHRETTTHPEYYPFINGGPEALVRDFISSDETVMIWYGVPGTGKTSAVRAMISSLGILPITAMKESVLHHKNFLRDIFAHSDETHRRNAMNERKKKMQESDKAPECLEMGIFDKYMFDKYGYREGEGNESRIPVIVIEDADILIASRESGNTRMQQLLNEADGLTTNHTRKIIFTTNKTNMDGVDKALLRHGRCYGAFAFRNLTPEEAVIARKAAGLPDFEEMPKEDIPLATALRKPRERFFIDGKSKRFGFGV